MDGLIFIVISYLSSFLMERDKNKFLDNFLKKYWDL